MPRFEFRTFLPVALLLLATGLVFFPGLSGDFLFDDFPNIVQNTRVCTAGRWRRSASPSTT